MTFPLSQLNTNKVLKNSFQTLSNKIQNQVRGVITLNINFVITAVLESDYQHRYTCINGKYFSSSYE